MGNLGGGLRAIDWNSTKLERFEKNFYVEDKRVSARSDREVEEFRRSKEMKVSFPFLFWLAVLSWIRRFKVIMSHVQLLPLTRLGSRSIL